MKDVIIMIAIVFFWFFLSIGLTYMNEDPTLQELTTGAGNTSLEINDISESDLNPNADSISVSGVGNFLSMWIRIITFRIPTSIGLPRFMLSFISFINFMLVIVFGLMIYRQIRSGGG